MASLFLYQQVSQPQVGCGFPHWHTKPMRVVVPLVGRANETIKVGQLHPGSVVIGLFPIGMTCSFYVAAVYFCERNHGDPMVLLIASCEEILKTTV